MNKMSKFGLACIGMIFTYDLIKRRYSIKHAEKLNDQRIMQLKLAKELVETGKYQIQGTADFGELFVADQTPTNG